MSLLLTTARAPAQLIGGPADRRRVLVPAFACARELFVGDPDELTMRVDPEEIDPPELRVPIPALDLAVRGAHRSLTGRAMRALRRSCPLEHYQARLDLNLRMQVYPNGGVLPLPLIYAGQYVYDHRPGPPPRGASVVDLS